jgi:hypothetical protein
MDVFWNDPLNILETLASIATAVNNLNIYNLFQFGIE